MAIGESLPSPLLHQRSAGTWHSSGQYGRQGCVTLEVGTKSLWSQLPKHTLEPCSP